MGTAGTFDDQYLRWLYSHVGDVNLRKGPRTYWGLLRELYTTRFMFFVPNDANRAMDGVQLRFDWAHETFTRPDNNWMDLECSFLEMLIALSVRASFQSDQEQEWWFWHLIENLNLKRFNDASHISVEEIELTLERVCSRMYKPNGHGGLFPLDNPDKDQRKVEIWYQLCEYVLQA